MKIGKAILAGTVAIFLCVSAQAGVADRIVAVVNDEVITLSELNNAFEPYQERFTANYQGPDREKALGENQADPSESDDRQSPDGTGIPENRDHRPE